MSCTIRCADPWLISRCAAISFNVTRRFSFTMAWIPATASGVTTRCAWPSLGGSVTELMPFMNFLVHSYTCCSDRHASPYWTFIRRWISMGFTPSLLKKQMTERCSTVVHVVRPPSLHYYCAVVLHSCIILPPVGHSSNHKYHCCQLTRQSISVSNFYLTFKAFIWLPLVDFFGFPACDYRNVFLVTVVTRKSMVILGTIVIVQALEVLAVMVMSVIKLFVMCAWVFV